MDRETEELFCGIQAQLNAQRIALRALLRSHPDPQSLLLAWRAAVAEALTCSPVTPARERDSEYFAEEMRACMEDWTAELVELAIPGRLDPEAADPFEHLGGMPPRTSYPTGPGATMGQPGP